MFLDSLIQKNPQATTLHQEGNIPANCWVLDLVHLVQIPRHQVVGAAR